MSPPRRWKDAASAGRDTLDKEPIEKLEDDGVAAASKADLAAGKVGIRKLVGQVESIARKGPGESNGELSVGKAEEGKPESPTPKKLLVTEASAGMLLGTDAVAAETRGKVDKRVGTETPNKSDKSELGVANSVVAQPHSNLDGASGQDPALMIYVAEESKSAQHVQRLLQNKELKLPAGAKMVGGGSSFHNQDFDGEAYFAALSTLQLGWLCLFSPRLPSTHTLLSQNWRAFPRGTVCVADVQFQGRGRGGNVWESPKGCLMFSYTLQMCNGRTVPLVQYVVTMAVVEGIEAYCLTQGLVKPDVRIKWPNDLYAKGLKVGGVLCTSSSCGGTFNLVVGVGLNMSNRLPTTCLEALLEDLNPSPHAVKREILLAAILNRFEELLATFISQGFAPLEASYYRQWLHSGQRVELEERAEDGSDSISIVPVTVQGLTPSGFLLATDEDGEHYQLHPDGNSFDFFKGLVRTKLVSPGC